jgi:MATE family multidrug resistance protein
MSSPGAPFLAGFGAPPKTAWEEAFDEASQEPELGAALTTHAEEGDEGERLSLVDRRESFLAEERAPLLRSWRLESGALLRLALPMALTNLCGYCIAQVTVIFVGR